MYRLVIDKIKEKSHIDLSSYDETFLNNYILKRFSEFSISTEKEYIKIIDSNPQEAIKLIDSMKITYTDFYRDPLVFSYLERILLPNLLTRKSEMKSIRIWCTGCSTGQEAYSVAFCVEKYIKMFHSTLKYHIFATDKNSKVLEIAKRGVYSSEELSNVTLGEFENNFEKANDRYVVSSDIRSKISFSEHDLLDSFEMAPSESVFGDFDIVFCCNLLFYYNTKTRFHIMKKLEKSLAADGYLITGSAEKTYRALDTKLVQASYLMPVYIKK